MTPYNKFSKDILWEAPRQTEELEKDEAIAAVKERIGECGNFLFQGSDNGRSVTIYHATYEGMVELLINLLLQYTDRNMDLMAQIIEDLYTVVTYWVLQQGGVGLDTEN